MTNYPAQQSPKAMLKTIPLIHLGLLGTSIIRNYSPCDNPIWQIQHHTPNDPYLIAVPV